MKKKEFQNLPSTDIPINAENLNEMQSNIEESCVIVSPTKPTTNEKVWIQKGKNLFRDSLVNGLGNTEYNNGTVIQKTTDTNQNPNWKLTGYNNYDYITILASFTPSLGRNGLTFVKKSNFNNIQLGVNGSQIDTVIYINVADLKNEETYTISFNVLNTTQDSISWKDIQIEQGTIATEYEEYIEKKIYCKNDNGIFEEFINAENEPTLESIEQLINITPLKGSNYDGYGNSYYYKKGSTVYVHLGLSNLTVNTLEVVYTLPVGYRPNKPIPFLGVGENLSETARLQIMPSGEIKIQSPSAYALFDFCFKAFK